MSETAGGAPAAATVSVARQVRATPERVWALVSDLTRMGEWSPENTGCQWLGDARGPTVGARFRGRNRNGLWRWSTMGTVVAAEPGRQLTFDVSFAGLPVARWSYELEPGTGADEGTTTVTERYTDRRLAFMRPFSPLASGVADRSAHNRRTMEATLAALGAAAERGDP